MSSRIAAVVLAAGRSKRFGPANKLLAIVHTEPLIARAMKVLARVPLVDTVVVTGRDHQPIADAVASFAPRLVNNADYARGIGKSIATGVGALGGDVDGVLIVQADMPFLDPVTISAAIAKFEESGGRAIVVPVSRNRREWGTPVLWPRDLFAALGTLNADEGARSLIAEHQERFQSVVVDKDIELLDVDSMETLQSVIELVELKATSAVRR